jgi:hypothetical protein
MMGNVVVAEGTTRRALMNLVLQFSKPSPRLWTWPPFLTPRIDGTDIIDPDWPDVAVGDDRAPRGGIEVLPLMVGLGWT